MKKLEVQLVDATQSLQVRIEGLETRMTSQETCWMGISQNGWPLAKPRDVVVGITRGTRGCPTRF